MLSTIPPLYCYLRFFRGAKPTLGIRSMLTSKLCRKRPASGFCVMFASVQVTVPGQTDAREKGSLPAERKGKSNKLGALECLDYHFDSRKRIDSRRISRDGEPLTAFETEASRETNSPKKASHLSLKGRET